MMRMTLAIAATAVALGGCNQAQEDRAAEQTASAIRQGNQALREITTKARDGAEKAAVAAREAAQAAGPLIGDAALTAKVKAALLADKDVRGARIDVDTQDGVVTLSGKVADAEADRAVEISRAVEGVKLVESRLRSESG